MGTYSLIIVFSLLHFASSNLIDPRNRYLYFNSSNLQPYSLEGDFVDGHALYICAKFKSGAAETLVLKLLTPSDNVAVQLSFNFTANEIQLSRRDGPYLMTQSDVPLNWPSRDSFQFFIVRHNDYFEVHGRGSKIDRIWIPSKGDERVENLVKFNISGGMTMDRAIYEAVSHSVFFQSRNGSVNLVKFNVSDGMTMDRPIYEAVNHSEFFQSSNGSSDKGNLLDTRNRYIYFNSSNPQPYSLEGDFVDGHALTILASFILGAAKTLVLSFLTALGEISLQLSFDFKANKMRSSRRRDGRLITHSVVSLNWPSRDSFDFSIVRRKNKFLVHGRDSIIDTISFPSEGNGSVENFVKFNVSGGMTMDRAIYEAVNHSVFFQSRNGSVENLVKFNVSGGMTMDRPIYEAVNHSEFFQSSNLLDTRNRIIYFNSSNAQPYSLEGDFVDGHALYVLANFTSGAASADTLVLNLLTPSNHVAVQLCFNFTANQFQSSRRTDGRLSTHSVVPLDWPSQDFFDFYFVRHNDYFVVHGHGLMGKVWISLRRYSDDNLVKFNISGGMTMERAIYKTVDHTEFFQPSNMTQPDCAQLSRPLLDVPYFKMPHELNRSLAIIMKPYANGDKFFVELYDRENIRLLRFAGREKGDEFIATNNIRNNGQNGHNVSTGSLTRDENVIKIINEANHFRITVNRISVGNVFRNSESNPLNLRIHGAGYVTGLCLV